MVDEVDKIYAPPKNYISTSRFRAPPRGAFTRCPCLAAVQQSLHRTATVQLPLAVNLVNLVNLVPSGVFTRRPCIAILSPSSRRTALVQPSPYVKRKVGRVSPKPPPTALPSDSKLGAFTRRCLGRGRCHSRQ